jgi:hypothetical protein
MRVHARKPWYKDAAARMAGFGSLSLLRYAGSGSWDRGLGRSAIGGSWRAVCDSCLVGGAWLFRDVEEINAEVKKRRESRLYLSMRGYLQTLCVLQWYRDTMCRSAHYLGAGGRADDRAWEMHLLAAVVDSAVALAWDSRKTLSVRTRNVGMGHVCKRG